MTVVVNVALEKEVMQKVAAAPAMTAAALKRGKNNMVKQRLNRDLQLVSDDVKGAFQAGRR